MNIVYLSPRSKYITLLESPKLFPIVSFTQHLESQSGSVMSDSLWPHGLQPVRLFCPWNFPDKNTGVGNYSLLQGIFPTQGSNPGLQHCGQILYLLSHEGSPQYLTLYKIPLLWNLWKSVTCFVEFTSSDPWKII